MKNLKVFASSLLAGLTINSAVAINASAKTKEETTLEMYQPNTSYGLQTPTEVILPTDITIYKDGDPSYTYSTVKLEFSKETINPLEIVNIMNRIDKLEDYSKDDKYVYLDKNEQWWGSIPFRTNTLQDGMSSSQFYKYLASKEKEYQESRECVDHSEFAEFMLPILDNYSYRNEKGIKVDYSATNYIYFYLPYDELSYDTDLTCYAEKVYYIYQDTSNHVITYDQLEKTKFKS